MEIEAEVERIWSQLRTNIETGSNADSKQAARVVTEPERELDIEIVMEM